MIDLSVGLVEDAGAVSTDVDNSTFAHCTGKSGKGRAINHKVEEGGRVQLRSGSASEGACFMKCVTRSSGGAEGKSYGGTICLSFSEGFRGVREEAINPLLQHVQFDNRADGTEDSSALVGPDVFVFGALRHCISNETVPILEKWVGAQGEFVAW